MIYNIFRLGCIGYSTAVTWNAVASEGSHAKQHAFLWIILFSGLMVEPFVDALTEASYVPWIKIGIVTWVVLAHHTMRTEARPNNNRRPTPEAPIARTSPPTLLHSPLTDNFDTMSERAENLRRLQRVQEIAATPRSHSFSSSNNLDFGRFKRELERRQRPESPALFREKSGNSMEEPYEHHDRDSRDHTTAVERFSRPIASSRPSSAMSNSFLSERATSDQRFSVSVNRPAKTATTNSILLPDNPFQITQAPAGPTPDFVRKASAASSATATAAIVPDLSRDSSRSDEYQLKSDGRNRKRPLSAIFSDSNDNGRRAGSTRPRSNRQLGRSSKPVSRSHDGRTRTKHLPPEMSPTTESALMRKSKRLRETPRDQTQDNRVIEEANFKVPQERIQVGQPLKEPRKKTQVTNKTPTSPMKPSLIFARPKPPGKHRASTLEQPLRRNSGSRTYARDFEATDTREGEGSSSRTNSASNSFEQRMQKVQVWIKNRNPSMLSPPLTSSSETMHRSPTDDDHDHEYDGPVKSQSSGKRKAQYQLRGKDPKRHHQHEEEAEYASALKQTAASMSNRHHHQEGLDPLRDQQDPDTSTLPPVDWSRFQVKHTTPRKPSLAASTRMLSSPYRSRTPAGLPRIATPKRLNSSLGSNDPSSAMAVSPLIRLRQSQLQRRQQEDFLGIKREGPATMSRKNQDEEEDLTATLQFNQVLETWEREDDETLARNAAREAEALEAKGAGLEDEGAGVGGYTMAAPMPSLQRVIPLHGESSRRPVPDFSSKKASSTPGGSAPSLASFNFRSPLKKSPWATKSSSVARTPSSAERRHPGLYTPSKKNVAREQQELAGTKSPYKTTPTMSRYTQLSLLTDDEDDR
ncbi:hypothetical protein BGZ59_002093 [Podila verticillata]|nr:hypothetical protein BGZ59_002093 [Podila verticillata]KAI9236458.1 MAG: hypothetical protein BYD32DRAFT_462476 [Podila humilis]KFH65199.1 hypothetical protein MVEG_08680 [Podila verticillata NRRL 6337]